MAWAGGPRFVQYSHIAGVPGRSGRAAMGNGLDKPQLILRDTFIFTIMVDSAVLGAA